MPEEFLYFAYGSNLNDRDWRAYCARTGTAPGVIEPIGPALLPDMQLCFDYYSQSRQGGALNIQPMRGHVVHGVLYRVSSDGWRALNRKEGAPNFYHQITCTALRPDGSSTQVITYQVTEAMRQDFCAPTEDYRQIVAEGLQAFGLPVQALHEAADNRPPSVEINRLFIYGTLLPGLNNAVYIPERLVTQRYAASIAGMLYDTGFAFPAIDLENHQGHRVRGECLRIMDLPDLLEPLDQLEGFAGYDGPDPLFRRTIIDVMADDNAIQRAWCYVAGRSALLRRPIVHGCWKTHIGA